MSKYRAVIFDLDGTLLNTIDDLAAGVNHVLALHGYPVHSVPEVQSMVGNGVARLMALAVPEGTAADEQSAMLAEFREYYFSHSEVYTKLYDGIEELLAGLQSRGIKTAVTSNKFDAAVKKLCDKYFGSLVTVAIGESADTPKKPDPKMVEKALALLGVGADEALYVGDSEVDIVTAKNAGLASVSCTWGFKSREFLISERKKVLGNADPRMMIDEPSELFSAME